MQNCAFKFAHVFFFFIFVRFLRKHEKRITFVVFFLWRAGCFIVIDDMMNYHKYKK